MEGTIIKWNLSSAKGVGYFFSRNLPPLFFPLFSMIIAGLSWGKTGKRKFYW
jgi:hypothetical protein